MIRGMLIGTGQVALNGHIPAYVYDPFLSHEVQIVAAVDCCVENLGACESWLPGIRSYQTVEQAFANEKLDFVDICTPPHARVAVIREATSRGWHILCEKPIATCLRTASEIQQILAQQSIVFMPCYQYPFSPLWQTVLEQVQGGGIGEVQFVSIEAYRERADPGNRYWCPGWRQRREIAGGGVLLDIGSHYFHLVHLMFGPPVTVAARVTSSSFGEYNTEDTAVVVLEYPTRRVEVRLSWVAPKRKSRLFMVGTTGSLIFDGIILRVDCGGRHRLWTFADAMSKSAYPRWYARLFREFFNGILEGRLSTKALDDAISALCCVEAAYASASRNRKVRLAELTAE